MKRFMLYRLIISLILALTLTGQVSADSIKNWATYRGMWFDIKYPSDFEVRPSLKGTPSNELYDSVFFTSPDGTIEFYVFSPQKNGNPTDIAINPAEEVYAAQKTDEKNGKKIQSVSIDAKDKTYTRSYVDTENTTSKTRLVFGIKYRNQSIYAKYKAIYATFKNSLRQYAD